MYRWAYWGFLLVKGDKQEQHLKKVTKQTNILLKVCMYLGINVWFYVYTLLISKLCIKCLLFFYDFFFLYFILYILLVFLSFHLKGAEQRNSKSLLWETWKRQHTRSSSSFVCWYFCCSCFLLIFFKFCFVILFSNRLFSVSFF